MSINTRLDPTQPFIPSTAATTTAAKGQRLSDKTGITNIYGDLGRTQWGGDHARTTGLNSGDGGGVAVSLTANQEKDLHGIAQALRSGVVTPEIQERWSRWVGDVASNGVPVDVNALVQAVLRESYVQTTEDLRFQAEKVKYFNDCKALIRKQIGDMRKLGMSARAYASKEFGVTDLTKLTPEQQNQMATWLMTHGNAAAASFYGKILGGANAAGRTAVLDQVDMWAKSQFGVSMPAELKDQIGAALAGGNTSEAVKLGCQWVIFCGKMQGKGGPAACTMGNFKDFCAAGVGPLSQEDAVAVAGAFGDNVVNAYQATAAETLVGMSVDAVVAQVVGGVSAELSAVETSTIGSSITEMSADLAANGASSATAVRAFGSAEAASAAMYGGSTDSGGGSGDASGSASMMLDLGISTLIPPPGVTSVEGLEAAMKGMEEKLNSVGDDAQLANVDLQNTLQKQQQTLQMMSNISKMLNDTAMAVIRKIGG